MMDRQQSLSKIAKELMLKEPFYGFFLINLNKVWDARRVPTAGVSKNNINYQLTVNPEFEIHKKVLFQSSVHSAHTSTQELFPNKALNAVKIAWFL